MTDDERREIEELLPFLANGSLEGEERARVEAAIAEDDTLAGELAALEALRATMQADAEEEQSPGAFGHARLMRELERDAAAQAQDQVSLLRRPVFWQMAAALLFAVVLGQAAFMSSQSEGDFTLASGGDADIVVAFAPDATEADIRTLLLDAGVEIISGPSALGLYELAVVEGQSRSEAADFLNTRGGAILESIDVSED